MKWGIKGLGDCPFFTQFKLPPLSSLLVDIDSLLVVAHHLLAD
jgi:hypothetical protein